jgi:septum formation protein
MPYWDPLYTLFASFHLLIMAVLIIWYRLSDKLESNGQIDLKKIILASKSPRRKKLLKQIIQNFSTENSEFTEPLVDETDDPIKFVKALSEAKALTVSKRNKDSIIISADTVVILGKTNLGKPKNIAQAIEMIRQMRGKELEVMTAFTIMDSERTITRCVTSKVLMRDFSEEDIKNYIKKANPLDKAGAYAIQYDKGFLASRIEGEYENIVGLPIKELKEELERFLVYSGE